MRLSTKRRPRRRAARTGTRSGTWPRIRIRIDFSDACALGPGKIALLEAIERVGSLSIAARELGMSYRRGWLLLDDLNRSFEQSVVTTATGGARGGGARITAYGLGLIERYRAFERATVRLAGRHLGDLRIRHAARRP